MKKLEGKKSTNFGFWLRLVLFLSGFILIVIATAAAFFIYSLTRPVSKVSNISSHRLPTNVIPSHYRLYIDASQLQRYIFHGNVDIDIEIKKNIKEIKLNSIDLNITQIHFRYHHVNVLLNGTAVFNEDYEQVIIRFNQLLHPGKGRLYLSFDGKINDQLSGFYRTKDKQSIGACTQFEPAYARRAFPCFDEPSFKANFSITIRSPKHLTTLSNMPVRSKYDDENDTTIYKFESTPIMSTYLVAYVIGYYDYVETRDSNDVLIRVYTPVGRKQHGLFALEAAAKILPFYTEYFGIEYPLSKLDMIAVADFASGAMENWGLITYRETYLLVDAQTSTQKTKQEVVRVVAHEIAHQWFGNLVTMEWWNDLWLNEGFASWIESLAVDYIHPEFDIWTQFVSDTLSTCMISDALHNSHPIEMPIRKPTEIDEIFDEITYEKGSSVIRLLHAYIGNEAFRQGLSNYLSEYAYKNTITDNLWSHLSKASNLPHLSDILSTWTKQIGFPLLTVEQEQKGNNRLLKIEQTRFLADGANDDSLKWKIPISICTESKPNENVYQLFLNGNKKQEFLLENLPENEWIKLNVFSVGIYRVHYPQSMLEALIPGIRDHTLSPQDRFNIQTDLYALALSGYVGYVNYLKLLKYAYKYEDNLTVWKSIIHRLTELGSIFEYAHLNNTKKLYQSYVCELLTNIYNKIGWDPVPNEGSQIPMLRSLILTHMGINGCDKVHDEAQKRFEKMMINNNQYDSINPNIRSAIYLTVAKTGNQQTFDQFKALYLQADTQEERIRLLTALCRFNNETLQEQALNLITNLTIVRKQDHLTGFVALAGHNRHGCEISWAYMQKNWKQIEKIYGEHDSHLIPYIENIPELFASQDRSEEVRKFYINYPNPLLDRSIKKALEEINLRRLVLERHEHSINRYLSIQ